MGESRARGGIRIICQYATNSAEVIHEVTDTSYLTLPGDLYVSTPEIGVADSLGWLPIKIFWMGRCRGIYMSIGRYRNEDGLKGKTIVEDTSSISRS